MIEVTDQAHLEALPDGTIISWLRILGDETSRAVAFVRVERDAAQDGTDQTVMWISPGGWQPMTPDEAGITYPVEVVRFGEYPSQHLDQPEKVEALDGMLSGELVSGGTYPRDEALRAAARVFQGCGQDGLRYDDLRDTVTDMAEGFERWLDRLAPLPDHLKATEEDDDQAPSLGEMADQLRALKNLGVTHAALMYAVRQVWPEGDR